MSTEVLITRMQSRVDCIDYDILMHIPIDEPLQKILGFNLALSKQRLNQFNAELLPKTMEYKIKD